MRDPLALADAVDEVVLDAAAGDRADDQAVARASPAGRPGGRGAEPQVSMTVTSQTALALLAPVARLDEDLEIETVHATDAYGGGRPTA